MEDYRRWLEAELEDAALKKELEEIQGNEEEIKERFAVALKFGTAGLRGVLGAGMNRMNDYEKIVNSITVNDIRKFADDLFKQKNEVEVTMVSPEKK